MRTIHKIVVSPCLPPKLEPLRELAFNLWWTWDRDAIELFRRIDFSLWENCQHNPVALLGAVSQDRLMALAGDESFLAHLERVLACRSNYMSRQTWMELQYGASDLLIAYFSLEYGWSECLPIYSGGLGVLAGDHLKSASDLGLPLVGVGLLYRRGYFRQYLNADGWQQEYYPENDFFNMPVTPVLLDDGTHATVAVEYPGRTVRAQVWRVRIGRIDAYLLDTDLPVNAPGDREITAQLYGGDLDMRVRQEILLGIGGIRALRLIGKHPAVCHMNEGHSAFLALERIRLLMQEKNVSFDVARTAVSVGNVFTTHTPVPAGNDLFPPGLMAVYFEDYAKQLDLKWDDFLALGRQDPADGNEPFCMTVLALRLSAHANGVSKLHGSVSRRMWQRVWPNVPENEIPIRSITNGVHTPTWLSHDMATLFDRYLGPRWQEDPTDTTLWDRVEHIPDSELWRTHERRRERLVAMVRRKFRAQLEHRGAPPSEILAADEALDPEALTIGFARRFATYKRATLLLRDPERIIALLTNKERPVQLIFAGKAHPADQPGKELIRQIVHFARDPRIRRRIVFLEDYDMSIARYLVQGVDVWLNNPTRPQEASGTSGMKVVPNGGLNLSIPDGWWDEADHADSGWTIGRGELYDDKKIQDDVESQAIYDLLEKEIVPLFYARGADGVPRGWVKMMKNSMRRLSPVFSTQRMVRQYAEECYLISGARYLSMLESNLARAQRLAAWKQRLRKHWPEVEVVAVHADEAPAYRVGATVRVTAQVRLGHLAPADVNVELCYGQIDSHGDIQNARIEIMEPEGDKKDGQYRFCGSLPCFASGQIGYAVRVVPKHEDLAHCFEPGLIRWA